MQASLSRGKQLPKSQSSCTRRFKRDRPAPEALGVFPLPHPELADGKCFSLFWKLARQEGLACALWRGPDSRQTQEGPRGGWPGGGLEGCAGPVETGALAWAWGPWWLGQGSGLVCSLNQTPPAALPTLCTHTSTCTRFLEPVRRRSLPTKQAMASAQLGEEHGGLLLGVHHFLETQGFLPRGWHSTSFQQTPGLRAHPPFFFLLLASLSHLACPSQLWKPSHCQCCGPWLPTHG